MDRRSFLLYSAMTGGAAVFNGLLRRTEALSNSPNLSALKAPGYGALAPAATQNTGETLLMLPRGFQYNVVGKVGTEMADGRKTPRLHDGMAAFQTRGELRVVRNHEINDRVGKPGVAIGATNSYDESAGGGTTTLVINPKTRELVRDFVSLSGTLTNCAGGRTPWGSWISCEETTNGQTKFKDRLGRERGGFLKPHGYCFEVPASADNNLPPVPLKAMGRFMHEAIAVDDKGIVYLTEDPGGTPPAGFYRFLPNRSRRLAEGTLQMLAVKGKPNFDLTKGRKIGESFPVAWVTIDNPDPEEADTDELAVYKQGAAKGGAIFVKLEGCFADNKGRIFFVSSNGGDAKGGQIWLYEREGRDEGRLTLYFESPDRALLDMPDNLFMYPNSSLLFMCEDSDYREIGGKPENFVRILTSGGKVADFAKNIVPGFESAEFAGATFSPNGKTLFVNVQSAGFTFAIWGDWKGFSS